MQWELMVPHSARLLGTTQCVVQWELMAAHLYGSHLFRQDGCYRGVVTTYRSDHQCYGCGDASHPDGPSGGPMRWGPAVVLRGPLSMMYPYG
jgi:hypothetical protein